VLQLNKDRAILLSRISHKFHNKSNKNNTKISLKYNVSFQIKLGGLNGYDLYRNSLVKEIEELRNRGLMYKEISEYLKGRGMRSSRGKELSVKIVERMLKKKWKSREKDEVKCLGIEDVEYINNVLENRNSV